jgi:hypothetical protein
MDEKQHLHGTLFTWNAKQASTQHFPRRSYSSDRDEQRSGDVQR